MNISSYMETLGREARVSSRLLARASSHLKNQSLLALANAITRNSPAILKANQKDVEAARASGMEEAMLDRLALSDKNINDMAEGVRQIAALNDPIGEINDLKFRPSGIQVGKMRVPLGVIGIIYEARPNVTIDAAALCLKSGNAAILRGGSEALNCNLLLANLIGEALQSVGLPKNAVQIVDSKDRALVSQMITMRQYIDVIVPRGGKGLIERLLAECKIPMIQHLDGNCHVYLDDSADAGKALNIVENAKTQRYGTCNTTETLLVARHCAAKLLPPIAKMFAAKKVEMRGCLETCVIVKAAKPAKDADYFAEFLAPIIAIKIVDGLDEAIFHINHYGSHHTDAIVTENYTHATRFLREVDSASVIVNASTRFADGFEYGLGAEIGISTDKIHARGPVGLLGLTSEKWIVLGNGEVRA